MQEINTKNALPRRANYLDMYKLRKNLEEREGGDLEKARLKVEERLKRGILVKGQKINMIPFTFYNPLWAKEYTWYYFECPKCKNKVCKIYFDENNILCGKCIGKDKHSYPTTVPEKMAKIQYYLERLNSEDVNPKTKRRWITHIVNFYRKLGPTYQADPVVTLKMLQKWCQNNFKNKELSEDYRKAMDDVLERIMYIRTIIIQAKFRHPNSWKDLPKKKRPHSILK